MQEAIRGTEDALHYLQGIGTIDDGPIRPDTSPEGGRAEVGASRSKPRSDASTSESSAPSSTSLLQKLVGSQVSLAVANDRYIRDLLWQLASAMPPDASDRTGEMPLLVLAITAAPGPGLSGMHPADMKDGTGKGSVSGADGGVVVVVDGGDAGSTSGPSSTSGSSWDISLSCTGDAHWVHNADGGWTFTGDSPGTHASANGN